MRKSALRSGLLTGLAQVVVALAAAGAGALLAHKFGRSAETDGFLSAYAVYLVLVLAAQSFRMVVVSAALAGSQGIVALAWGLAANAGVALTVPAVQLFRRGALRGAMPARLDVGPRLWHLVQGAAVPVGLQGCYLLGLRFAARLGVGSVTSFSYAYLAASTLVGATAFSLGLISAAPMTRRGVDAVAAGRHVVHASWVSLSIVGAAAGVFAVVGGRIVGVVLGSAYSGSVGRQLGHLVVYLAPWMLAWVAFAVTFPLGVI